MFFLNYFAITCLLSVLKIGFSNYFIFIEFCTSPIKLISKSKLERATFFLQSIINAHIEKKLGILHTKTSYLFEIFNYIQKNILKKKKKKKFTK